MLDPSNRVSGWGDGLNLFVSRALSPFLFGKTALRVEGGKTWLSCVSRVHLLC